MKYFTKTMQQTKKMTFKASTLKTLSQNSGLGWIADKLSDKELLRAYASNLLANWHLRNSLRSELYNKTPHRQMYLWGQSGSKDLLLHIEKELEKRHIRFECIFVEALQGLVEFDLTMHTVQKTKTTVKTVEAASKLTA
ncbi:MAG: hypothetical protein P1P65_00940 [Treponema sp.]